jgi:hypothetical protein
MFTDNSDYSHALRAHLAELGITAAQGTAGLKELLKIIANGHLFFKVIASNLGRAHSQNVARQIG